MSKLQDNASILKICHVSTLTAWGGVERMLVDFLLEDGDERLEHVVLTTSSREDIVERLKQAGIEVYQPSRAGRYDLTALNRMGQWLREQGVGVVHSYNAYANVSGYLAASLASVPVFVTGEHGTVWEVSPPRKWLDQLANQRSDLVVCNSEASKKMLQLRYHVAPEKIRVVYNGVSAAPASVDLAAARRQLGLKGGPVVGSVGRLEAEKHFSTFIRAAADILRQCPDVQFLLVGGGSREDALKALARELGVEQNVIFTGWREDARALVGLMDVFVSTSIRETLGNALIEAAMAGKPVIAPRVDGIPEVVVDRESGMLLTPTEPIEVEISAPRVLVGGSLQPPQALHPDVLADAILNLLDSPELCYQYGQRGQEMAKKFQINNYKHELEQLYLQLSGKE